jgi:glycosyltransferase involved in cell wall biosynthesis
MPLVSVVLIFLNEERFLEEAVQSVRDQTLTDWELILVDDGSTDRSTKIARDLSAQDERIRYIDHEGHENRGMAASRNLGAAHTTAPYVGFLDGDDVLLPNKLSEQVDVLESMPDVAMVNGAMVHWHSWKPAASGTDDNVVLGGGSDQRFDPPEAALTLYPLGPRDGPAVDLLVRRSVFEAVGGFEESFRGLYEDQSFKIKVFLRYPIYISSHVWLRYRQHDASACAQVSPRDYLRLRGIFLDWVKDEVERLDDPRVSRALRRAERHLRFSRLMAPLVDRVNPPLEELRDRVPEKLKDPVRRAVRRMRSPASSMHGL